MRALNGDGMTAVVYKTIKSTKICVQRPLLLVCEDINNYSGSFETVSVDIERGISRNVQ